MQQFVEQLKSFYQGLGARERGIFTAAILASLITPGGVFFWASQTPEASVHIERSERGPVSSSHSEEKGVPYRISPDGLRLETTVTNVGRARIEAASAGKNPGFETLDNIKLDFATA